MSDPFAHLDSGTRDRLRQVDQPDWLEPMLARLTHDYFDDPDWIYERKLDGERCLVYAAGNSVHLYSRNRKSLDVPYPELRAAFQAAGPDRFIVDGEVVAFDGSRSSFARLQQRMHVSSEEEARASGVKVYFYAFDLLYLDSRDTTDLPLRERKGILKQAFSFDDPLRFLPHRNEEGLAAYDDACRRGWEGLIAKDATASYVHGRSAKWLKFKCVNQQEFVVGGYTDPQGERTHFGALLIGVYQSGDKSGDGKREDGRKEERLRYAGKVGTGYDEETLRRLGEKLTARERESPPFDEDELPSDAHWVDPELVVEVGFTEWTPNGKLRHPRYLGLRRDKAPQEVVREDENES